MQTAAAGGWGGKGGELLEAVVWAVCSKTDEGKRCL